MLYESKKSQVWNDVHALHGVDVVVVGRVVLHAVVLQNIDRRRGDVSPYKYTTSHADRKSQVWNDVHALYNGRGVEVVVVGRVVLHLVVLQNLERIHN